MTTEEKPIKKYNREQFYYKDCSVTALLGTRGSGKSTLMVRIAMEEWAAANNQGHKDYKILHNGFIDSNNEWWGDHDGRVRRTTLMEVVNLLETGADSLDNSLILFDEVQSLLDARFGMNYGGVMLSHFLMQIRKRGISVIYTTQFEHNIDRRLKEQTDVVGFVNSAKKEKGRNVGVRFVHQGTFAPPSFTKKKYYNDMYKAWPLFDTHALINSDVLTKEDIYQKSKDEEEDLVYKHLLKHTKKTRKYRLQLMEIKMLIAKDLNIKWDTYQLRKYLENIATQDKKEKMFWSFNMFEFSDF